MAPFFRTVDFLSQPVGRGSVSQLTLAAAAATPPVISGAAVGAGTSLPAWVGGRGASTLSTLGTTTLVVELEVEPVLPLPRLPLELIGGAADGLPGIVLEN